MSSRRAFRSEALESLEERQVLSTAAGMLPPGLAHHHVFQGGHWQPGLDRGLPRPDHFGAHRPDGGPGKDFKLTTDQAARIDAAVDQADDQYKGDGSDADKATLQTLRTTLSGILHQGNGPTNTPPPSLPAPGGPLGAFAPTKAQFDQLRAAADQFAAQFTGGADANADKAAFQQLRTQLEGLFPHPRGPHGPGALHATVWNGSGTSKAL